MKYPIKFAELHSPLFLGGTNLQLKLDPARRTGIQMVYDQIEKELLVTWNNETAIVPTSNVASMVVGEAKVRSLPTPPPKKIEAQVETPQSHVFGGEGKGKSR
jgi:hypothetical protein